MPGYHIKPISKGTLGDLSKIREELDEAEDAREQGSKIMELLELSDLYGALKARVEKLGCSMEDLSTMSRITCRAFRSGERT